MRCLLLSTVAVILGCATPVPKECTRFHVPSSINMDGRLIGSAYQIESNDHRAAPQSGPIPKSVSTDVVLEAGCREDLYDGRDNISSEPKPL